MGIWFLSRRLNVLLFLAVFFLIGASRLGAQTQKIKLGSSVTPPALDSITPYVALDRGFFKKNGLDVQIVEFRGDATHNTALLAGDIDLAIAQGATAAIVSVAQGAKLKLVVVPQPITPYVFVARQEAGTTFQALIGKNVGVSGIGAISYHIPRIVIERSGVDPDKMKYVAVGTAADRFRALVAGKIDATAVTSMEAAKLAKYPDIVALADVPKLVPEIPYEFGMVREDYIQKNSDIVYRITKAIIEANRWIAANKAGTVEIVKKILPDENVEDLTKAYEMLDPRIWGVNGDLSKGSYDYTADFLKKVGYLKAPVPYDKFFDRRFVDRALKELGRK